MWIKKNLNACLAGLICVGLLLSLHDHGALPALAPALHIVWPLAVLAVLYFSGRLSAQGEKLSAGNIVIFSFLCLYLFSSAAVDPHFIFHGWLPGADTGILSLEPGLVRWLILTALILPLYYLAGERRSSLLLGLFLLIQLVCFFNFMAGTGGHALYRDDHSSFMYRLWSYVRIAPDIIYYDPTWNGGHLSSHFIGTGIIPLGTIFWPFWRFGSMLHVYTPVIGFIFIVIMPWIVAGSVRMMNADRTAVYSAGLLALGLCWPYYEYTFHFGTVGSSFCTMFILPVFAALYRIIWLDLREKWTAAVLVVSSLILLLWPGSVFISLLLFAGALLSFRRFNRRNMVFLLVSAAVLIAVLLPFYIQLSLHSQAGEVMRHGQDRHADLSVWAGGWTRLCGYLRSVNPVILFAGLAGLLVVRERGVGLLLLPFVVGGLLLTGWGDEWRPLFQFHRTIIPLSLLLVVPAALTCSVIMQNRRLIGLLAGSALFGLLVMSGYSALKYCRAAAKSDCATIQPYTFEMIDWLKDNTEQSSRILFAGRTVHAVGGGHVAFLPVLTGREMMACDYYHFSPKLVEYDYPPKEWRKQGFEKTFEFMDLYNVGYVVTYHEHWKNWLRNHADQYEELHSFMQSTIELTVFRVRRDGSFFLKGEGTVSSGPGYIDVSTDSEEIVLKYNWADGLKSVKGVELFPFDYDDAVQLIGVRPNGVKSLRISY